jgi:hypothetical protein
MFECWRSSLAPVCAHGGAATLQFGSEDIDAGDTVEVVGDIATDGPVCALRPWRACAAGDRGSIEA